MLRHLKNSIELVLYAGASCGVAFFARLFPAFYYPDLLLRIGVFLYCLIVIFHAEGNRLFAALLGASIFLGLVGGYWDLIEVFLNFDADRITGMLSLLLGIVIAGLFVYYQWVLTNGRSRKR